VIIAMGVYPQPFLRRMDGTVNSLILRIERHSTVITDRRELGVGNRKLGVEAGYPIPHSQSPTPTPPQPTAHCLLPASSPGGGR
jgi:hypothetical protein